MPTMTVTGFSIENLMGSMDLVSGCWSIVAGRWLLVSGYWPLVAGHPAALKRAVTRGQQPGSSDLHVSSTGRISNAMAIISRVS
jgi:hypothetical protein